MLTDQQIAEEIQRQTAIAALCMAHGWTDGAVAAHAVNQALKAEQKHRASGGTPN